MSTSIGATDDDTPVRPEPPPFGPRIVIIAGDRGLYACSEGVSNYKVQKCLKRVLAAELGHQLNQRRSDEVSQRRITHVANDTTIPIGPHLIWSTLHAKSHLPTNLGALQRREPFSQRQPHYIEPP